MSETSWKEHFKKQITNAESLYSADTTNVSLLLFCLRAQLISSEEYLEWAKETYQLPILTDAFFQNTPVPYEIYRTWKKINSWGPECLPVAEWEGNLIVACLDHPPQIASGAPCIYVLTHYENLERTWKTFQQGEKAVADPMDMTSLAATVVMPKAKAAPEAEADAEEPFFNSRGDIVLKDQDEDDENSEKESSDSSESEESAEDVGNDQMPDGLFGSAKAPSLAGLTGGAAAEAKAPPAPSVPVPPPSEKTVVQTPADEMDLSIDLTTPQPVQINHPTPQPMKKGPRTVEAIATIDILRSKVSDDESGSSPLDDLVAVDDDMEQAPALPLKQPLSEEDTGDIPKAPVRPAVNTVGAPPGVAAYFLDKVKKQNGDAFERQINESFQQLKNFFNKSMVLAVGDKDRVLKPVAWDENFRVNNKQAQTEVNLKKASIFRVAVTTQKPYHGYVVVNDVNESFFETWNQGQLPDHVTIVPILDGDLVVGLVLGIGEKSCYNKNVLQFTEKVTKELTKKLLKPQAKAA